MTRRDLIRKITIGGVTFLVMPSLMTDCTKNKEMDQAGALTIDLNSSAYSALKTAGGSVISGKIIIMNIS